jgi:hypothetical protein
MNDLNVRIGRREAVRTAILGALVILAGCGDDSSATRRLGFGGLHRKDKKRQAVLARLRSGATSAMPPDRAISRMQKTAVKNFER